MKALITFEHSSLPIHAVDFISILKHREVEIDFVMGKVLPSINDPHEFFKKNVNIIDEIVDVNSYDVWFFEPSSWEGEKTPYLDLLHSFKGILICLNYEDGYNFFTHRYDEYTLDKCSAFINNSLYIDRNRYDRRIRSKLMLVPSYISNSQDFKDVYVDFHRKQTRAIFTGSLTGSSETGNKDEENCRTVIPRKLIEHGFWCIYNIHGFDPSRKSIFDGFDSAFKSEMYSREKFIKLYSESLVVLSIKGNGHTVNRFFEGLAANSLVLSTPFDSRVEFIGQGTVNKDYIEIDFSGKDVVDIVEFYSKNLDKAKCIADSGRKMWETFSRRDSNGLLPKRVCDKVISDLYYTSGLQV